MDKCPKCNNKMGFAFGTCVRCGYNYLDKTYHTIKVNVEYLPRTIRQRLIEMHDENIEKIYGN